MIHSASFIIPKKDMGDVLPTYRKIFKVERALQKAELCVTAMGTYAAYLGGTRIGDAVLTPGWTTYEKRHQYQTYDITSLLKEGENVLTVTVGKGWYRSRLASWMEQDDRLFLPPGMISSLTLTYADGGVETIRSDESFEVKGSPYRFSEIYDGEHYDARLEDEPYGEVMLFDMPKEVLIPEEGEKIKEQERIRPRAFFTAPNGEKILDFGQNMTGYITFTVTAHEGDEIHISHAEILDRFGNFYTGNLRSAKEEIRYICKEGVQTFRPTFTFFGFRYIRLDSFPGEIDPDDFTAIVVHSDMKRTGHLSSSNPKLNQLFSNIIWGQKGNFLDVPTDCPQRDERLGWTGDAQVFVRTASYNFDVLRFFKKWLRDLASEQEADGWVPHVVPNVFPDKHNRPKAGGEASAAWGDAAIICPWQMYLTYGDTDILKEMFPTMLGWLSYIKTHTTKENLWTGHPHYGDWLGLDAEEGASKGATPEDLIASAYYYYSTSLVSKIARIIGEDSSPLEASAQAIRKEFIKTFTDLPTQTACTLALYFDLTDDKEGIAEKLNRLVVENGNRLTTGFVGTPYLLHALSENGYAETAYALLLQEDFPSWLFSVNRGATTIWEHWDGVKEDGSFWDDCMNSYNHYAYGAVADWVYGAGAGIRTVEEAPGFEKIVIAPIPTDKLDALGASIETRFGLVESRWHKENGAVRYEITTPSPARIIIEGKEYSVLPGKYIF